MSDGGGGIVDPNPSNRYIFGTAEEGVGNGGVAAIDAGERQGVLFTHTLIRSLLPLMDEVAVGELVAVKALMSTTARAIKDGEGGAR